MKKFLALLFAFLMPFCFLFGCADNADRYSEGYEDGVWNGYSAGYEHGKSDNYSSAYSEGYSQGKTDGYSEGYNEAKAEKPKYEYKNGLLNYNCTISSVPETTDYIAVVFFDLSVECNVKSAQLVASFFYYDSLNNSLELLYREETKNAADLIALESYELIFTIPVNAITSGKTVYSVELSLA